MKTLATILSTLLFGYVAFAFETVLPTNTVSILPSVSPNPVGTYSNRNGNTAVTVGQTLRYGAIPSVVTVAGTTANTSVTNQVVATNKAVITVSGSLTNSASGLYFANGTSFTNANYTVQPKNGKYRLILTAKAETGYTNSWIGSSLIGNYVTNGAYTGTANVAYAVATNSVVSYVTPSLNATGSTTDGTAGVMRIPTRRTRAVLSVLSGNAVFSDAAGNKIYQSAGALTLDAYSAGLFGSSTNSARVEVFSY